MTSPSESDAWIAICVTSSHDWPWPSAPETPTVFQLQCKSNVQGGNFLYATGRLTGPNKKKCKLLQRHGWTVVESSSHEAYLCSIDDTAQQRVVERALERVAGNYEGGREIVAEYSEDFARNLLEALNAKFPSRVQMIELKQAISPEPSDSELLVALDALLQDGYVEGPNRRASTRESNRLEVMANIGITKEGRAHLTAKTAPSGLRMSNMHFHGPVGAVGHHSTGSVTTNQQWSADAPEPDWDAVVQALSQALAVRSRAAASREDYVQLAQLASAKEEAEKKERSRFFDAIVNAGQGVLPILASAGAHGLIAFLEQHLGWKLE